MTDEIQPSNSTPDLDEAVKNLPPESNDKALVEASKNEKVASVSQGSIEDKTRTRLSMLLVSGLIGTIFFIFVIVIMDKVAFWGNKDAKEQSQSAKELITLVLTTQTTLIGTALGFYFGSRTTKQ
jgi:hypothetical protein